MKLKIFYLLILPISAYGNLTLVRQSKEEKRIKLVADVIIFNLKENGWKNIISVGNLPDTFYRKIKFATPLTLTVCVADKDDEPIENVVPYRSNTIIIDCESFDKFEDALMKAMGLPYFHPLANVILYYHSLDSPDIIAKLFMILWYYKAANSIIIQYDDNNELLFISHYNPYVYEKFKLDNNFGCWKTRKLNIPISGFNDSFSCESGCHNISLLSKLRSNNLGTCLGYNTNTIHYDDDFAIRKLKLFEDKTENFHGFTLKAYASEVLPFLQITEKNDGSYSLDARDGLVWETLSKLMNFNIDLSLSRRSLAVKRPFDFKINAEQVFSFANRKADILIFPVYQIDLVIVEVDMTFAFKDSGICILSHRAGYETVLFDIKILEENYKMAIMFSLCIFFTWLTFFIFNSAERGNINSDQAGKDLINTVRNILSISLPNYPKNRWFRIFLTVSIWGFFVINFTTQAAITSFFTAFKKGKEVETFEDIIEKGYNIEGLATPDVMLPETEEIFLKINSKFVPIYDFFECIKNMVNDSRRFCLVDCAVGRYLVNNKLNDKGQQYLHLAKDQIHTYYLNMILWKNSPMTERFNKYMMTFVEAGLVRKWEQYRFSNIKEEVPIKALNLDDLKGIFKCYGFLVGLCTLVFLIEVLISVSEWMIRCVRIKTEKRNRSRITKTKLKLQKIQSKEKFLSKSIQTDKNIVNMRNI